MNLEKWLDQEYNGWHCMNKKAVVNEGVYARFERDGTDTVLEVPSAQVLRDPVQAWNQFRALADKTDAKLARAEQRAAPAEELAKDKR